MTTAAREIRASALQLATRIFYDLLPHDDDLTAVHNPRRVVPPELQIEAVGADTDLAVNDVLVLRETRRDGGFNDRRDARTVREYIQREPVTFALVVTASRKTITVRPFTNPAHSWDVDLRDLGAHARDYTERIALVSQVREVSRLGTLDDITARVKAHPWVAAYGAAYDAAQAERQAELAELAASQERSQERARPALEAAARLNELLGEKAFTVSPQSFEGPWVYTDHDWRFLTAGPDAQRGVTHLHGLAHQGRLPEDELEPTITALRLLASLQD